MPAHFIQRWPIPCFLLKILLYQNLGRNTGKTRSRSQATKPDQSDHVNGHCWQFLRVESKSSAPAWTHKGRASTLVVGVIANKFHKVLVINICMKVAYAWQPYMRGECNPWASNTPSIKGKTLSTNQVQAREFMGPHDSLNARQCGMHACTSLEPTTQPPGQRRWPNAVALGLLTT